ncbi:MAG: DUF177 domain-containing protein [Chloroflexi bacterium]|nr:DUF177 domain-containing protein [Chloroflexota bacterium]
MLFNVSQFLKESAGFTRALSVDDVVTSEEADDSFRVVGEIHMLRTEKGIWVKAKLSTDMACSCSRCLVEFDQAIEFDIQEEFLPRFDIDTGARLSSPTEYDEDFYISQNHILDLKDAAGQYVYMNTPMKPVCSEQCKGLCLNCGVNRNEQACTCQENRIDPRWGALVDLSTARTPDAN